MASGPRVVGTLSLGIFTFSFIANLNGVPALAEYALASVAFYALAVIGLLGPTALVSSELGAAWPRTGGIYVWAREAFGPRVAFLVIWLEWSNLGMFRRPGRPTTPTAVEGERA